MSCLHVRRREWLRPLETPPHVWKSLVEQASSTDSAVAAKAQEQIAAERNKFVSINPASDDRYWQLLPELHWAARGNNVSILRFLLENKASPNSLDEVSKQQHHVERA